MKFFNNLILAIAATLAVIITVCITCFVTSSALDIPYLLQVIPGTEATRSAQFYVDPVGIISMVVIFTGALTLISRAKTSSGTKKLIHR